MKTMIISYSVSGNNEDLARSLAKALAAVHISISEYKPRTMGTMALDMVFNRTPAIRMPKTETGEYDLVIFVRFTRMFLYL